MKRRELLKRGAVITGGTALAALGGSGLRFLASPLERNPITSPGGFVAAGHVDEFKLGLPKKVSLRGTRMDAWTTHADVPIGSIWVNRLEGQQFDVFSTICPHLGCGISKEGDQFFCPCHGSHFEVGGVRKFVDGKNPSPRDMDKLEWKVEEKVLYVQFRRFQLGTEDKVELV